MTRICGINEGVSTGHWNCTEQSTTILAAGKTANSHIEHWVCQIMTGGGASHAFFFFSLVNKYNFKGF